MVKSVHIHKRYSNIRLPKEQTISSWQDRSPVYRADLNHYLYFPLLADHIFLVVPLPYKDYLKISTAIVVKKEATEIHNPTELF